ncbi:MAG: cyclopropane-fatty-acyl-phospholipid synthase family protein [Vicinamibacterales bacterium]
MSRAGIWLSLLAGLSAAALAQQPPAGGPDAFFVPTRTAVADAMLRLAKVTSADVVYDLGSGDGRIVVLAAQKYGARGVGVEIDPGLVARAREAARDGQVADRVRFVEGDLFTAEISEATVVTIYLSTLANRRLAPRLYRELRPGARIVSQQFDLGPAWEPDRRVHADDADLFLWTVPSRP